MTRVPFSVLDGSHLALMLLALFLSYALPFELVVFSYAVLGPAHYLTEISWLHDRSYFLPHRMLAVTLFGATVLMVILRGNFGASSFILIFSLAACVALVFAENWQSRVVIAAAGAILGLILARNGQAAFFATVMIPSLVHVSLFTFIFVLVGYFNSGNRFQLLLAIVYVAGIALILILPPQPNPISELSKMASRYFGGLSEALGDLIGVENVPLDSRIAGLLSFVYTYHYLNWFIKVRLINWHRMPKWRLGAIALMSLGSTGLYFYDYGLGLSLLFSLSLLHVLLEFPLNAISFRRLAAGNVKATQS